MDWFNRDLIVPLTLVVSVSGGVYWLGELSTQVAVNTIRLADIERNGSPALLRSMDKIDAIQQQVMRTEHHLDVLDDVIRQHFFELKPKP